ncbi:MAG: sulfotransferase [Pseudomonadota bacterium]
MTSSAPNGFQAVPNFIVIGAMRAGTTTLYELLRAGGTVGVPRMKETDFFKDDVRFCKGEAWLRKQFSGFDKPTVDISPNYTKRDTFPGVAERIRAFQPAARFVYIVRDPVTRAVSQYKHMSAMGRTVPAPEDMLSDPHGQHILNTSRYAYQLAPFLEYWPIDDILVLDFDHLVNDPAAALRTVYDFFQIEAAENDPVSLQANTSEDLQKLPSWWGAFRRSSLGEFIRARAPRTAVARAKSMVSTSVPKTTEPAFADETLADIASALRADADSFRQLTGQSFPLWSV